MTRIEIPIAGSIALALLAGCGVREATAPANNAQKTSPVATDENVARVEPGPVEAPAPTPVEQPDMSRTPAPPSAAPPHSPPPPAPAPARRDIRLAPEQPPAEVDPPHRHPGDEVPR